MLSRFFETIKKLISIVEMVEKRGVEPRSIASKTRHLRELDSFYPLGRADVEEFKERKVK